MCEIWTRKKMYISKNVYVYLKNVYIEHGNIKEKKNKTLKDF